MCFPNILVKKTNEYLNSAEQIPRNWTVDRLSVLTTSWDITWWCSINLLWKELMECMSEHTGLISSLSLLLVQTQATRWTAATPEQLTGAHLYLDIAKSGYLFHAVGNVMLSNMDIVELNDGLSPALSQTATWSNPLRPSADIYMYHQISNVRCTLICNKIFDHSDVVGASPVGAAPTTSSFST